MIYPDEGRAKEGMKKEKFDITQKAIIVPVDVEVDFLKRRFKFLVDTGTQYTIIDEEAARAMWLVRGNCEREVTIRTVTGSGAAYEYKIDGIEALGITRRDFHIMEHPMPEDAGADGLLGLNFFDNTVLSIDFNTAEISVDFTKMCHQCRTVNPANAKFCMECATQFN